MKIKTIATIIFLITYSVTLAQIIGSWKDVDTLHERREDHSGIKLANGNILIVGGTAAILHSSNSYRPLQTDIFDTKTFHWKTGPSLNKNRSSTKLVGLDDESVLAVGGYNEASCEILNKEYSAWSITDSLKKRRISGPSVIKMQDGNVLLSGGYFYSSGNINDEAIKECEIYNFSKKEWSVIKELNVGRWYHSSTLFPDGKILVTGGSTILNGSPFINSCEIYDPKTNEWKFAASMNFARSSHSATLLSNGKVLVVGGGPRETELYDPVLDKWDIVGLVNQSSSVNSFPLLNGEYLLIISMDIGMAWELYSLRENKSVYNTSFNKSITKRVVVMIDDNSALTAGGEEWRLGGDDLYLLPSNYCQIFSATLTGINERNKELPASYSLSQNFPNPFNPSTTIKFSLPQNQFVTIKIFDMLGREITTLVNEEK